MKLEERKNELSKCRNITDFENLYEKVFGKQKTETRDPRDPSEYIKKMYNAILDNKKMKEVPLNGADI